MDLNFHLQTGSTTFLLAAALHTILVGLTHFSFYRPKARARAALYGCTARGRGVPGDETMLHKMKKEACWSLFDGEFCPEKLAFINAPASRNSPTPSIASERCTVGELLPRSGQGGAG